MTVTLLPLLYTLDMPISGLRTAEILVIVTLRLRAIWRREPGRKHPNWKEGLQAANLPWRAIEAFEELFQIVATATSYPLDVRGLHCPRLSSDEGRFLQILYLFQHQPDWQAEAMLENWLPPAASRLAASPAISLAGALEQSGLQIPLRDAAPAVTATQVGASRGLRRLQ
jgi:hypothetical protein